MRDFHITNFETLLKVAFNDFLLQYFFVAIFLTLLKVAFDAKSVPKKRLNKKRREKPYQKRVGERPKKAS